MISGAIWNFGAFIIALGILITIHEFGHFWVARRCGVRVLRFSIGFGPKLWSRIGRDGTEYVLALIPLGGYVKMVDGREEELSEADKPFAFDLKSVWARMAIVAAGPLANFLFAIFALWLMYLIGVPAYKPVIDNIRPNSVASIAGVEAGSEIKAINGEAVQDWESVSYALIAAIGDDSLTLTVTPPHTDYVSELHLSLDGAKFDPERESPLTTLGIQPLLPKAELKVAKLSPKSSAESAGIMVGDELISVDGTPLVEWSQFVDVVQAAPNRELALQILRQGKIETLLLVPASKEVDGKLLGFVGISPTLVPVPERYQILLQYDPLVAVEVALKKTWSISELTIDMLGKLLHGVVSLDSLSGPISIAKGAGSSADYGLVYFLSFLALISINLGVINLVPLPVLDGGHLLFFLYEGIVGRPIPVKVQEWGFRLGAALLIILMGIALLNDFARL